MFAICDEFEFYSYRRVGAALRQQGVVVNNKKIRRLMREHGLQPKIRRRFIATTDSDHGGPIFPNLAQANPLRLRRHRPRCLVAPDCRLRHRPVTTDVVPLLGGGALFR
ncbi:transposase, partial [Mesorhizobium sp. M4B.F.Ca.ET.089.01.1.1]|uniref:IS3 family transposase n=1 Tax=Mesorhizobium sp. M4B.F.Ca.ET.089.01.1.1 TaxID=2496662 RepID=UPI000FF0AEEA